MFSMNIVLNCVINCKTHGEARVHVTRPKFGLIFIMHCMHSYIIFLHPKWNYYSSRTYNTASFNVHLLSRRSKYRQRSSRHSIYVSNFDLRLLSFQRKANYKRWCLSSANEKVQHLFIRNIWTQTNLVKVFHKFSIAATGTGWLD